MNLELTDDGFDVFIENPGRNIGVLQSGQQVIRVPTLNKSSTLLIPIYFWALFDNQRVDSLAEFALEDFRFCSSICQ